MPAYRIAPSIVSADFVPLGDEVRAVIAAGADWIHVDGMDDHCVPKPAIGPMVAAAPKPHCVSADGTPVPLDEHLMVRPGDALANAFADAGADLIGFRPGASTHVDRTVPQIRPKGCRAGLASNPAAPLDVLEWVIDEVDLVLILSVDPGFGGQSSIDGAPRKTECARRLIDQSGRDVRLEVGGGIRADDIRRVADAFVAGRATFGRQDDRAVLDAMRGALAA